MIAGIACGWDFIVVNIVIVFMILFPLVASVGLYVSAIKKQSRQLFKSFLAMFLFTAISTIILLVFVEYALFDYVIPIIWDPIKGNYVRTWGAVAIVHLIVYIISKLLLIAAIAFFTTEIKRVLKKL